jgi:hypothetical protein
LFLSKSVVFISRVWAISKLFLYFSNNFISPKLSFGEITISAQSKGFT